MTVVLDWANLLLRWAHLGFGIAWIGTSFYFVWLDASFTPPAAPRAGVDGELWMTHGGNFYRVEKQLIRAGELPPLLHWFKYEALFTWVSGILLLAVAYYLTGGAYLVDPAVSSITPGQATLLSVGLLVAAWVVYDLLWLSPLGRAGWPALIISYLLLAGAVYGLCRVLSGRAAYIHVGAILGTVMVANVWMRILPAQRRMLAAGNAGRTPDYEEGKAAKRRSMHNSYMTLPVLFIMLSNHYPQTYGNRLAWLALALLIVAGAAMRHLMIGKGSSRWWAAAPLAASLAAVMVVAGPPAVEATSAGDGVPFGEVRAIINQRCLSCHSQYGTDDVFNTPPGNVTFDTPEQIVRLAARIKERAVATQTMPMGNKTGMTDDERTLLGHWIDAGARLR